MRLSLNTTLGLMGVVACIAVVLATYLAFESEKGSPLLGLVIGVACTAGVTALRTAESSSQRRADGEPVTFRRLSTTILKSCVVAILIVGLADLAFLLTYGLLAGGPRFFLFSADARVCRFIPEGCMAGTVAAVAVGYLTRRGFWRSTPIPGRFLYRLASLEIVVLLLGANVMWERTWYRLEQADQHDIWVGIHGGASKIPPAPPALGFRRRAEMAAYHARMRRKWEHAAARPWLSVDPDPPPP
jgi:hypothetical protein